MYVCMYVCMCIYIYYLCLHMFLYVCVQRPGRKGQIDPVTAHEPEFISLFTHTHTHTHTHIYIERYLFIYLFRAYQENINLRNYFEI